MFDLPSSPIPGQIEVVSGIAYEYSGYGWKRKDYAGSLISIDTSALNASLGGMADDTVQAMAEEVNRVMVLSDPTGITGASRLKNIIIISQANYDAIAVPDPETFYVIAG
jgi:hypothetical protein